MTCNLLIGCWNLGGQHKILSIFYQIQFFTRYMKNCWGEGAPSSDKCGKCRIIDLSRLILGRIIDLSRLIRYFLHFLRAIWKIGRCGDLLFSLSAQTWRHFLSGIFRNIFEHFATFSNKMTSWGDVISPFLTCSALLYAALWSGVTTFPVWNISQHFRIFRNIFE